MWAGADDGPGLGVVMGSGADDGPGLGDAMVGGGPSEGWDRFVAGGCFLPFCSHSLALPWSVGNFFLMDLGCGWSLGGCQLGLGALTVVLSVALLL